MAYRVKELNLCEYNSNDKNNWDFCFISTNIKYKTITYKRNNVLVKNIRKHTKSDDTNNDDPDIAIRSDHGNITLNNVQFTKIIEKEEHTYKTQESYNVWKLKHDTIQSNFIKEYEQNTINIQEIKTRLEGAQTQYEKPTIIDTQPLAKPTTGW